MSLFPNAKVIITIGPFTITWYAFFIVAGALIAYGLSLRNLKKMGYPKSYGEDLFFGALPAGIIGARLWYVAFEWSQYASNPISAFYIWQGGLGLYGGVFAGMLYGLYFTKKHKLSFLRWADAIVPNILIAQALGRWGNFVNQEAYGRVVSETFYRYFPQVIKTQMFIDGSYREPTFLYESSLNLLGFLLIAVVYKKYGTRKRGDLFFAYFAWYGVVRFFVEGFRADSLYFLGFRVSQMTSLVLIVVGVLGIVGMFKKLSKKKPVVLFDLDGTILDTDELIFASFRHVFKIHEPDLVLDDALLTTFLGPTLRDVFSKYSDKDTDMLIRDYITFDHAHHQSMVKVFPHASELLQELKKDGYQLGIVSSKYKESIDLGLSLFELSEMFDVIVGIDNLSRVKPDPEGLFQACDLLQVSYDRLVYVGDSPSDIQAGKRAGAYTIGVTWTRKTKEVLEAELPDQMISDLMDVVKILKEDYV